MRAEVWAVPATVRRYRYSDGSIDETIGLSGPTPAYVHLGFDLTDGQLSLTLSPDDADDFARRLTDAAAAARATPVEERTLEVGKTRAEIEAAVDARVRLGKAPPR